MEQTVTREEEETVIRRPWGPEVVVDNSDLSFKAQTSQTILQKMRSRSAAELLVFCELTSICSLEVVRNGINPSVKKDLHAMIEGLIKSVSAQILNQLYAADSLLSDVKRLANKVLSMLQGDDEDKVLAYKCLMIAMVFKSKTDPSSIVEYIQDILAQILKLQDLKTAVNEELNLTGEHWEAVENN